MKKEMRDSILVVAFLFGAFAIGYEFGADAGFDRGVEVNHGDKWDCAYSYATGFLMCDRTPKYKD